MERGHVILYIRAKIKPNLGMKSFAKKSHCDPLISHYRAFVFFSKFFVEIFSIFPKYSNEYLPIYFISIRIIPIQLIFFFSFCLLHSIKLQFLWNSIKVKGLKLRISLVITTHCKSFERIDSNYYTFRANFPSQWQNSEQSFIFSLFH